MFNNYDGTSAGWNYGKPEPFDVSPAIPGTPWLRPAPPQPFNAYGVLDLKSVAIPPAYEIDGDTYAAAFRIPVYGGEFISTGGDLMVCHWEQYAYARPLSDPRRLCVRKIAPKTQRVLVIEITNPSDDMIQSQSHTGSPTYSGGTRTWWTEERPIAGAGPR